MSSESEQVFLLTYSPIEMASNSGEEKGISEKQPGSTNAAPHHPPTTYKHARTHTHLEGIRSLIHRTLRPYLCCISWSPKVREKRMGELQVCCNSPQTIPLHLFWFCRQDISASGHTEQGKLIKSFLCCLQVALRILIEREREVPKTTDHR